MRVSQSPDSVCVASIFVSELNRLRAPLNRRACATRSGSLRDYQEELYDEIYVEGSSSLNMLLHQHKMRVRSLRCRLYDGRFTSDRDFV